MIRCILPLTLNEKSMSRKRTEKRIDRLEGRLADWHDEKGFGFITPSGGGPRVFAHISAFPRGARRPRAKDRVRYSIGRDRRNRLRAEQVVYLGRSWRPTRNAWGIVLALLVAVLFFGGLGGLIKLGVAPYGLALGYGVASVLLFGLYGLDKWAAGTRRRRIEEATLHLFAVAGGWPGGLLGQRVFRHKTRKQPFQAIFWVAVFVNCAALLALVFAPQAAGVREALGFN